jgi:hypothetical protein
VYSDTQYANSCMCIHKIYYGSASSTSTFCHVCTMYKNPLAEGTSCVISAFSTYIFKTAQGQT